MRTEPAPITSEGVRADAVTFYERAQTASKIWVVLGTMAGSCAGWLGAKACGASASALLAAAAGAMIGTWTGAAIGRRHGLALLLRGHETLARGVSGPRRTSTGSQPLEFPN